MSTTSSRTVQIGFSGVVASQIIQSALENIVSPAETFTLTLPIGNTTIAIPVIAGIVVTGLTIIPPPGNTALMKLKGVNGDTGFPIHKTDPTSIGIDPTFVSLVINCAAEVVGLILIFS